MSYTHPKSNASCVSPDKAGIRQKVIESNLYELVNNTQVCAKQEPSAMDYTSVTHADYTRCIKGTYTISIAHIWQLNFY